jgi:sterol 14-demethylase
MAKYRIIVDHGLCQGHSVCAAEAPELFRIIETGQAYPQAEVTMEFPPEELLKKAEAAEEFCPNGAIRIIFVEE